MRDELIEMNYSMSEEHSNEALRLFGLEITKQRVAYLKYIRARGYEIDEDQLLGFEKEIEREENRIPQGSPRPLTEHDVADLQQQLAFVDLFTEDSADYLKALLLKRQHTKVKMRAERNHQRAHFHVEYKREFSASYAVDTLERMAGHMPRRYEDPILEWAAKHQRSLAVTWQSLRAGEDVRELILVHPEA